MARTAREVIRRIEELGGYLVRIRGSHARYEAVRRGEEGNVVVTAKATVPLHGRRYGSRDVAVHRTAARAGLWRTVVDDVTDYRVTVRRDPEDARFWLADVDGLEGAHTYSRSLATLDRYVREAIVVTADLPDGAEEDLRLEWLYRTGDPEVDREAEELRRRRAELDAATRALAEQTGGLARRLVTQDGLSVREAATLLGISPARVDQIVQEPKKRAGRAA